MASFSVLTSMLPGINYAQYVSRLYMMDFLGLGYVFLVYFKSIEYYLKNEIHICNLNGKKEFNEVRLKLILIHKKFNVLLTYLKT